MSSSISRELMRLSAKEAAMRLIGCRLQRYTQGGLLEGVIVETEAYDQSDIASHSYRGLTKRNSVMFGPPGCAYVYFTYGMHYCVNVVVGDEGKGEAVLIRAIEPTRGLEHMATLRKQSLPNLCNGPAKLCQALAIDLSFNGHNLSRPPLKLIMEPRINESEVRWTTRIGIREEKGSELLWRACLSGSRFLSRPL